MRILLDTNALIWAITDQTRIPSQALRAIRSGTNDLLVSHASLWELAIKIGGGKLVSVGTSIQYVVDEMRAQRVDMLPLALHHIYRLERLERLHNDPFDRIFIAQALEEQLTVITADRTFVRYDVDVLW